jgi:hypothetical protein
MESMPVLEQNLLKTEITGNYRQYKQEPQERTEKGKLLNPLAEIFEVRMNRALEQYYDLSKVAGRLLLGVGDEQA